MNKLPKKIKKMNTKKTSFGALSLLFMLTVALFSGCVNNTIPATEDNETVSNTGDGGNVTFDFVTSWSREKAMTAPHCRYWDGRMNC